MTLCELLFYVSLTLFFPSVELYDAIKVKGLIIILIESITR